jgi:4-amino-4-deoxy-L-arabinose transferase-like glycosyltransferase
MLIEMWYAWAMALDGPVAAGLLQWLFGALLAAAAVLMARPLVGRRAAQVCGALVLLTPGVNYQMGAPLDDLALALFTTLLLTAWWQGAIRARGNPWLIAAGLMAGAAAGTKLVGLVFAVVVLAVSIALLRRQLGNWRILRRAAVHALCPAVLVGGVWYLWAAWHGGSIAAEETTPGAAQQIGGLLIATLPGLLLVTHADGLKPLACVALVFGVVSAACLADLRWWAPLVPLLAVAATLVWREVVSGQGFARRVAQVGLLLLAVGSAAMPLARARGQFAVAIGWQSREDYLARHQASYPAALLANQIMRPGDSLLSQDPHTFYFSYPATDARTYRRCVGSLASANGESISQQLRSAGFTHVLLAEPAPPSPIGSENDLGDRIGREIEQSGQASVLPLAEYQWSDASSTARRYRLVKLR